jgi:hypothetical protein
MRFIGVICAAALAAACRGSIDTSEAAQAPAAATPATASAVSKAAAARESANSSSFVVGIAVQYSGSAYIEPVVRFDGSKWLNTWPEAADMNVPVTPLDQIPDAWLGEPVPREWTLRSSAGESVVARIVGTQRGGACNGRIQLTVDTRTASLMKSMRPYIAVDRSVSLGVIRDVTKSDAGWATVVPVILKAFAEHERLVFDEDVQLRRRLSPEALANRPVTIPFLVGPGGPLSFLYFEATKRLAQREDGVAVTGWLRRDSKGRWTATDVKSRGLGGDGNPVPGLVPLATMNINGRQFWFMDERGYEGAAFELMEMTSDGLKSVLNVGRGGC